MDKNRIPQDYTELYQEYFTPGKLAPTLCKKMLYGKQTQDWEDASQDAYMRLLTTKILEKFDATKSNFGGMVFVACRSACCNMGKTGTKEAKNLALTESSEEQISGEISGDRLLIDNNQESRIIAGLETERLRERAHQLKDKGKHKRFQNQEKLIDLLLEGFSKEEIAGIFGISRASVDLWISALAEGV